MNYRKADFDPETPTFERAAGRCKVDADETGGDRLQTKAAMEPNIFFALVSVTLPP